MKKECECTNECLGYLTKECKRIEEPKQETLEEAAERKYSDKLYPMYGGLRRDAFKIGAKWQQEISYSEEEVKIMYRSLWIGNSFDFDTSYEMESNFEQDFNLWFEQFKNK
jgi:hypothetical protein